MNAEIISAITTSRPQLPLFGDTCAAGFPPPAQNYIEAQLDLNEFCILGDLLRSCAGGIDG